MNEGLAGLKRHDGEQLMTEFSFLGEFIPLTPVAPDNILRCYETKQSVCARNWTLFKELFPVNYSLRQTKKSDSFQQTGSFGQFVSVNWFK